MNKTTVPFLQNSSNRSSLQNSEMRKSHHLQSVRSYQKVIVGLAVVTILMCMVVLGLTFALFSFEESGSISLRRSRQPIACIECNKLVRSPSNSSAPDPLLDELRHTVEEGVDMCCAYDSREMSALLELSMQKQEVDIAPLPEFDAKSFRFSPASAHKRLYPPQLMPDLTVPKFEEGRLVTLHFNKTENDYLTEHARGVDVLVTGLRILHTGLYYLYSSIHFRPESVYPCKEFQYQTWGHYISRTSPNKPSKTGCLLKTAHTCCDDCTKDEETSFTSGVFFLNRGDVIQVEISGHGLVFFQKHSSFAGLMMLGSGGPDGEKE